MAGVLSCAGVAAAAVVGQNGPGNQVPADRQSTQSGSTPSDSPASAPVASQALTQTISVAVHGGSLFVRQDHVVVPLTWDSASGRYRGHTSIDVVDARGTLTGWTLKTAVEASDLHGAHVWLRPSAPVVVDGEPSGLVAGKATEVHGQQLVTLGSATAGDGGGSYRVPVDVELSSPHGPSSTAVAVTLMPQVVGS